MTAYRRTSDIEIDTNLFLLECSGLHNDLFDFPLPNQHSTRLGSAFHNGKANASFQNLLDKAQLQEHPHSFHGVYTGICASKDSLFRRVTSDQVNKMIV
jgi:hypothetical protein